MPSAPNPAKLVRGYPADEVTTRDAAEVDPGEAGLTPAGDAAMWSAVVHLYGTGLHPAVGLCVRHRGKVVLNRTIGHAHGNAPGASPDAPRVLATPRTLFNLYSASKAVT